MEFNLDFSILGFLTGLVLGVWAVWLFFWKAAKADRYFSDNIRGFSAIPLTLLVIVSRIAGELSIPFGWGCAITGAAVLVFFPIGWLIAFLWCKLRVCIKTEQFETVVQKKRKERFEFWDISLLDCVAYTFYTVLVILSAFVLFVIPTIKIETDSKTVYSDKVYYDLSGSQPFLEVRGKQTTYRKYISDNKMIQIRGILRSEKADVAGNIDRLKARNTFNEFGKIIKDEKVPFVKMK